MIPVSLKRHLPLYRKRWHRQHQALIEEISALMPALVLGGDAKAPWIEDTKAGVWFSGFETDQANALLHDMLRSDLPEGLKKSHFRLVRDYVTRYVYPHLRPDLKPAGYGVDELSGFHGQHKDAIADLECSKQQKRLKEAFLPRADDTIIDGGAFIGMGDVRMSRDLKQGRIIAVEAKHACHELLAANIAKNNVENVEAVYGALWNVPGQLDLNVGDAQANSLVGEVVAGNRSQQVQAWTIDGLVKKYELERVSMVSLTLNGAEVEALEGAVTTLEELRPRIRLAGWYDRGGVPVWQSTRDFLVKHRYEVFVGPRGSVTAMPLD